MRAPLYSLGLSAVLLGMALGCGSSSSSTSTTTDTTTVALAIGSQPSDLTVALGSSATFSVTATGTGTLTYQWYLGGTAISGATSATYTIASALAASAGDYYVIVTDSLTSVTSSTVTLTVTSALTLATQPSDLTVALGSSATFSVTATGTGTLSYQWYLGGTAISGATSATYTIASALAASAGDYYVIVTDSLTSVTSSTVTLTVTSALAITTQPSSLTVDSGGSATFTVAATSTGTLTYQWYKDDAIITGANSASLTLNPVATTDAGTFYVTVSDTVNTLTSSHVTLTVNEASATGWVASTGANSADLVSGTTFAYTVAIDLGTLAITSSDSSLVVGTEADSSTPITLNDATVITVAKTTYGLTITSSLPNDVHVEFALSGTYAGSITFFSGNAFKLGLNGATIASSDGPALNIQSDVRAFVVLQSGTTTTLSDTSKYSTRYLSDGTTAMDLKGAFFSEGPILFSGEGTLVASGNKKNVICSDAHVRLTSGTLTLTTNKKDAIHANNAFVMDGGTLKITSASAAGKGVKVEGKEDTTEPLGFIVINGGTVDINTYDKAITASWEAEDDATTTDTTDDPDPYVNINGGTITINTFGTPYEDPTGENSLSPEGIESKTVLTINGGDLTITTTDDGLNTGTNLVINGGNLYVKASANDAVDSNGTMFINGGVVVVEGPAAPECGLDCDQNEFGFTGGTVVGMGGSNSTPYAASCTQDVVSLGAGTANTLKVVLDANDNVVFAFLVPYACESVLVSTGLFTPNATDSTQATYTVYSGGTVTAYTTLFHGLYLGVTGYTKGTKGKSFSFTSKYISL